MPPEPAPRPVVPTRCAGVMALPPAAEPGSSSGGPAGPPDAVSCRANTPPWPVISDAYVTQAVPVCPSVASPGSVTQHLVTGPSCTSGWPKWSTASESVPSNATQGLPSDPVAAVSLLLVNGMAGRGGTWVVGTVHCPPDSGRFASNVPSGLFPALVLMPFHTAVRPLGVTTASGSVARKNFVTWADAPTVPLALTGVSMTAWFDAASVVHSTCSTPSVPRASPMSSMMFVPAGVTLDHVTAAAAGAAVPAKAAVLPSAGRARPATLTRVNVTRTRTLLRSMGSPRMARSPTAEPRSFPGLCARHTDLMNARHATWQ